MQIPPKTLHKIFLCSTILSANTGYAAAENVTKEVSTKIYLVFQQGFKNPNAVIRKREKKK